MSYENSLKKNNKPISIQPKIGSEPVIEEKIIKKHQENKDYIFCSNIFETYQNCMYSKDDIILCNQALELYYYCLTP